MEPNQTAQKHKIDERSACLDYVFHYDDTQRICLRFEWPMQGYLWQVKVIEGDNVLAEALLVEVPEEWEPDLRAAQRLLLRFWRGDFPSMKLKSEC